MVTIISQAKGQIYFYYKPMHTHDLVFRLFFFAAIQLDRGILFLFG